MSNTSETEEISNLQNKVSSLSEEVVKSYEELNLLYDLIDLLSTAMSLEEVTSLVLNMAWDITGARYGVLLLSDGEALVTKQKIGCKEDIRFEKGEGLPWKILESGEGLVIDDRSSDELSHEKMLAYKNLLCTPIKTKERSIGVLMLMEKKGEVFNSMDLKLVNAISAQSALYIESYLLHEMKIEEKNKEIKTLSDTVREDLEFGSAIQRQFFLREKVVSETFEEIGYKVAIYNKAPATISGDFYYVKPINNRSAGFFFADVCGHGVPAALISMRVLSVIDHLRSPRHHPSEFLEMVNDDIYGLVPAGKFIAATYLILGQDSFSVSSSAQPYPVFIKNGEVSQLQLASPPLGLVPEVSCSDVSETIESGDKIILYSDGIIEEENDAGEIYGDERLLKLIKENAKMSPLKLKETIVADLISFVGSEQFNDDVTITIFEKTGGIKND